MTTLSYQLDKLLDEPELADIKRQATLHYDLPKILLLLGGSASNFQMFEALDEMVAEGGTLEGQSKRSVQEDELESDDTPQEYVRPNGETYYARDWTGIQDVKVLQMAREHNQFPFLYGPPGTGKTALAEAAHGLELVSIVFSGDTEVSDLVGQFVPNALFGIEDGQPEYTWQDGPLVVAMESGRPLYVDEVGLGDPKVLSILYSAMDGRREVRIPGNPKRGVVKAVEGFGVIGSTNPHAPGVNLSEALLSRFTVHVEVTTDWALATEKLGVPETIAGISASLSKKLHSNELGWAPQMRELIAFRDLTRIYGETFAVANLLAAAPEEDRDIVREALARFYGAKALPARI